MEIPEIMAQLVTPEREIQEMLDLQILVLVEREEVELVVVQGAIFPLLNMQAMQILAQMELQAVAAEWLAVIMQDRAGLGVWLYQVVTPLLVLVEAME
jgi:hypothetical protein